MNAGRLAAIYISDKAAAPMRPIKIARLFPGRGIEGDRYFCRTGAFSRWRGPGRDVTLIDGPSLAATLDEHGIDLRQGQSRRNLVTKDVHLPDLNGKFFRIGSVLLHGASGCSPCKYLERLVPGSFKALAGRGGLRAEIIEEGTIRIGDAITPGR